MLGSVPSVLDTEPFIVKPVYAQSRTNTTVYLPGMEKNLTTGEINKYYSLDSVTLQRNTRGGVEKLYYLFPDHLLSTRLVVDKEVKETDYLSYYPYGNLKAISLPSSITNLYTGQKQDREVNLYYYHARYYNPTVGHFISADSAQGPNRYAYVKNNPVMLNDPSGNCVPFCLAPIYYMMAQQGKQMGKEAASLISSDMSLGYKALGAVDIIFGHTLSNTVFAVNEADPFRGGTLSWNSGVSIGQRAGSFGSAFGNSLLLSSQIVGTAQGVGSAANFVSREGALALYSKYGSKELVPAIKALKAGSYDEAFSLAEGAWRKADNSFSGFYFTDFSDPFQKGAGPALQRGMSGEMNASLAIHESTHGILGGAIRKNIIGDTRVTLSSHYGLEAQDVFTNEMLAYLAEYAGGVKGVRSVLKGFNFSFGTKTGGTWGGFKAMLLER